MTPSLSHQDVDPTRRPTLPSELTWTLAPWKSVGSSTNQLGDLRVHVGCLPGSRSETSLEVCCDQLGSCRPPCFRPTVQHGPVRVDVDGGRT